MECTFRGFRSGDMAFDISLLSADLSLCGRRLLLPRREEKLLHIKAVRLAAARPTVDWTASWAQGCVLFRQCDYDFLQRFLQTSVFNALPNYVVPATIRMHR